MGVRGIAVAAALAVAALAAPASAGKVPTPVLTATGGTQQGTVLSRHESAPAGKAGCAGFFLVGAAPMSTDPVRHDSEAPLRIRLDRADQPVSVSVEVDRSPVPVPLGTRTPSRHTLVPVSTRGRVTAWDVLLPPPGIGNLYLYLHVEWRGLCGNDSGLWRFHLLAVP